MAVRVNRGEIWRLHRPHPDKRRPVVVISRSSLIPILHTANQCERRREAVCRPGVAERIGPGQR